ncbi:MAG: TPM domain-containing protein [Moorellales bacterium]
MRLHPCPRRRRPEPALLALIALLAVVGFAAVGFGLGAPALPPAPTGPNIYVNDFARVLEPEQAQAMYRVAAALDRATGAQLVVVTVETLGGVLIEQYALELFRHWGIGQREKNNGVLLLVNRENMLAGRSGRVRIEVGYGLEGAIPDGRAGRILDEYVLPPWEEGRYGEGIYQGFMALAGAIAAEYGLDLSRDTELAGLAPYAEDSNEAARAKVFPVLFLLVLFFILAFGLRSSRRFRGPGGPFWGGGFGGGFGGFGGGLGGGGFGGGGFGGGSSGGGGASR